MHDPHVLLLRLLLCLTFFLPLATPAQAPPDDLLAENLPADSSTITALLVEAKALVRVDLLQAMAHAEKAFELANRQDDYSLRLKAVRALGNTQISSGEYADALILYESELQAMDGEKRNAYPVEAMKLQNNMAAVYFYLGDYEGATEGFSAAMDIAIELKDSLNEAKCLQNLGACFSHTQKFGMAEKYLRRSLELKIQLSDSVSIPSTYISLADIEQLQKNNPTQALHYIDLAEQICLLIGDKVQLGDVMYKRATLYLDQERWRECEQELERAYNAAEETNYGILQATILSVLGNCRVKTGDYAQARQALNASLELAKQQRRLDTQEYIYYWLSKAQELEGNPVAALQSFQSYEMIKDSIRQREAEAIMAKMEAKYQVRQFQEGLLLAESEREEAVTDRNKTMLYAGILIMLGLFVGWREWRMQRQRKALLEAKLTLKEQELASGRQKLEAYADSLREKGALIDELQEKLRSEPENTVAFDQLLQMKILTDEDWKQFKILFSSVHPTFISNLRQRFPQLTMGEQRLILLLKLNMTNKEIADILGVSAQAVKVARHRLRKKIELDSKDSLQDFVTALG